MKLIYLNPPVTGLGDRLLDLMLLYSFAILIGCDSLYTHWVYDQNCDTTRPCLKLENVLKYLKFPDKIYFLGEEQINKMINNNDTMVFSDVLGAASIFTFLESKYMGGNKELREKLQELYFESFKKLEFLNIPIDLQNIFINKKVATVHLRRTDKIHNPDIYAHGVTDDELILLNKKTEDFIKTTDADIICLVSDDINVKNEYYNKFANRSKYILIQCIESDKVLQAFYDFYLLANSDIIFMSQKFSTFSIVSSLMVKEKILYYPFNYGRMFEFNYHGTLIKYNFYKYPNYKYFEMSNELSRSQLQQDLNVIEFYKSKKNGYFVEIGAFDGIGLSNTYMLEKYYDWKGICVEPIPSEFNKLVKNRSALCYNKAVYGVSNTKMTFAIKGFGPCSGLVESLDKSIVVNNVVHERGIHHDLQEVIEVDTITFTDLLNNANAPNFIEYLSLDTEGSELTILNSLDFNKYTFGVIDVEHNYVEPRRTLIRNLLEKNNYSFIKENNVDDHYVYSSLLDC